MNHSNGPTRRAPAQAHPTTAVHPHPDVDSTAVGCDHVLALTGDGTVKAWGKGAEGRLGNDSVTDSNVPVGRRLSRRLRQDLVNPVEHHQG
ncbi:hypothetical protein [Streptomyces sp. NPDC005784]|uniref:hypothetical protein n=1 Tax=Streptomyces sp. NPDC005784 TaxID=3364731 RepID=UPI0036AB5FC3